MLTAMCRLHEFELRIFKRLQSIAPSVFLCNSDTTVPGSIPSTLSYTTTVGSSVSRAYAR